MTQATTEYNVGRWCLSEDECISQGINFTAYERGVMDAAKAFGRNTDPAFIESRARKVWNFCAPYGLMDNAMFMEAAARILAKDDPPGQEPPNN